MKLIFVLQGLQSVKKVTFIDKKPDNTGGIWFEGF